MDNSPKPSKHIAPTLLTQIKQACTLENICKNISESRKNFLKRTIFSLLLINYFCVTIYLGPIAIIFSTLVIQVNCFFELMGIVHRIYQNPRFRQITWYFLVAANYFFFGENLMEHFGVFFEENDFVKNVIVYHRFTSFLLYLAGTIWFTLLFKEKDEFVFLIWMHFALFLIVWQSYMVVDVIFQGLIWVILLVTCVSYNDIMAYVFGKLFGKTQLIEVSPNKTWEGFIGGGIFTMIYALTILPILCHYDYLVCPIEYKKGSNGNVVMSTECEKSDAFQVQQYGFTINFFSVITADVVMKMYPFVVHAFWLSFFSNVVAPFAGFFASGFKRAFEVKDFGWIIPGHGGILDRCDCQILMATFVNVYVTTFAKTYSTEGLFGRILAMNNDDQVKFFHMYESMLVKNGLNTTRI